MDFQSPPAVITATPTGFVAKLNGAIHTNTAWIESEFKKIAAAKPKAVDLDLSETSFLSSSGIGLLVWLRNEVAHGGGTVRIVSIRKRVLAGLKYAHLERVLQTTAATVLPD
jgi:anti-anti-sigma factor